MLASSNAAVFWLKSCLYSLSMDNSNKSVTLRPRSSTTDYRAGSITPEHCMRLLFYRKWLILSVFVVVSVATVVVTSRMKNIYISETVILVDPQKVPDNYVKATVSGDIRNRLGTLKQQILSATRLQKIIDSLNLYPGERKTMAREDVITRMRSDIEVSVVSEFGGSQDLQAFRIIYSGADPQLVSQVANELASLFIEENLKAREQQAEGTAEFLTNQMEGTRKTLEEQESKLKDFRLKHIGEMPEQQTADLQIAGQLQSQLQLEGDALNRAQQQKDSIVALMASQPGPVVDLDDPEQAKSADGQPAASTVPALSAKEKQLAALLARGYTESYPDVRRLRQEIEREKPKDASTAALQPEPTQAAQNPSRPAAIPSRRPPADPSKYINPVLQAQLTATEAEIATRKDQIQVLSKQVASYEKKLESIPVNEQEITGLIRDYEISKAHYGQLLNNQLSAETATQLEVRQKGEKFSILDPAQPAQKPSKPNRALLNAGGSICGLALGLFMVLITEILGMSISSAEHLTAATGLRVLEVIPTIDTQATKRARKRRFFIVSASGAVAALAVAAILTYHYVGRLF